MRQILGFINLALEVFIVFRNGFSEKKDSITIINLLIDYYLSLSDITVAKWQMDVKKGFIIESINFIRSKDKKPTTESIFNYIKTKTGERDLDLSKSSLETLLDDKIIENRPRKNDKSGGSYYTVDNKNTDSSSDSKTENKTSNPE